MGMKNITLFTYTHSNCKDLHTVYFERIKKYSNIQNELTLCDIDVPSTHTNIYSNDEPFYKQILDGLYKVNTEYVLYSQEDYILFDYIKEDHLSEYINLMDKDKNIGFIRLIKSGIENDDIIYNDELSIISENSQYYYSTQATIWRKSTLIDLFNKSKSISIRDEVINSQYLRDLNIIGLYTNQIGKKVGGHYNSLIWPYISTAIVLSKWNTMEYKNELYDIFDEFKIDKNKRGENV